MSRYFFHLETPQGSRIEDLEGMVLPSSEAAREEAFRGLRDSLANAIQAGRDLAVVSVVIADEQGREIDQLPVEACLPERLKHLV